MLYSNYKFKRGSKYHLYAYINEIITTAEHPFYVPKRGWTEAIELRAGDVLVNVNGEYVILEKIEHELLESPVKVYNFEVEDFHTYYVGDSGVLVHNKCNLNDISTGRTIPNNLEEQIAMKAARSDPMGGEVIINKLNDPRFPSGFVKLQRKFETSKGQVIIHYVGDLAKQVFYDFKFK